MYREIVPQWRGPQPTPRAHAGQVDVWRIALSPAPTATGREQAQAALRDILGRYLACAPDRVPLKAQPHGKPYIDDPATALQFNLAHCRDLALIAVTTGRSVGVDVEAERRVDDPLRLAQRVLTDEEVAELAALPAARRPDLFLDLWTRMEARQKAVGRGIFAEPVDPASISGWRFRPAPHHHASLALSPPLATAGLSFLDYGRL